MSLGFSWAFLEKGVDSVMTKLEDGLDMKTVSFVHCFCFCSKESANFLLVSSLVYGYLHVSCYLTTLDLDRTI